MSNTLYSVINPIVKFILSSPLHGLMSHNTLLLEFKGRKSGRVYTTPVSYHATRDRLHCFTAQENKWWKNLLDGQEVSVTLRGRKTAGKPAILSDASTEVQSALRDLLVAVPRDASHSGVALDVNGQPVGSDVVEASQRLVLISIKLRD